MKKSPQRGLYSQEVHRENNDPKKIIEIISKNRSQKNQLKRNGIKRPWE
jgi:hypothetical protein